MTTTRTTEQAIEQHLEQLSWMIHDAKRELAEAAQQMARRAAEGVKDTEALKADAPCSLTWVEFAEGDLRQAREAKLQLTRLLEQETLLQSVLKRG